MNLGTRWHLLVMERHQVPLKAVGLVHLAAFGSDGQNDPCAGLNLQGSHGLSSIACCSSKVLLLLLHFTNDQPRERIR